ncbi:hypothetical protein evm_008440 [Chilo suppressalis]|nr:hypothetical protein evm_008440 [Chilo suppressalis]
MLGMEVRSDLNPKDYIETVINHETASRKLGVLNKVRHFFTTDQLSLLYKTLVRSCVEYCSHLWDGSANYLLDALDSSDDKEDNKRYIYKQLIPKKRYKLVLPSKRDSAADIATLSTCPDSQTPQ